MSSEAPAAFNGDEDDEWLYGESTAPVNEDNNTRARQLSGVLADSKVNKCSYISNTGTSVNIVTGKKSMGYLLLKIGRFC